MTSRATSLLALAGLLAVASCSDDPAAPSDAASVDDSWSAYLERYTGVLDFVTGTSTDDVITGGDELILRGDGEQWRLLALPYGLTGAHGGWTNAFGDLFVYDYRRVYRLSGEKWDYVALPSGVRDICGPSTGGIFVGTYYGSVYRYDGDAWAVDSLPDFPEINGLHARAEDDAYAVGYGGRIAHYDGTSWTTAVVDGQFDLYRVWSPRPGMAYVIGNFSELYEYANGALSLVPFPESFRSRSLWGSGRGIHVAGTTNNSQWMVQHNDGSGWSSTPLESSEGVRSGWTAPTGEIFTVTWDGLWRTRGAESKRLLEAGDSYSDAMVALWASEHDGVFAAGTGAYRYDGRQWSDLRKEDLTRQVAAAIHGTDRGNIYLVGDGMIIHYDGQSWDWVNSGFQSALFDVWVSGRDVLAVGRSGAIVRGSGDSWEKMASHTAHALLAISGWEGGAVAVGEGGTILRLEGSTWIREVSPTSGTLRDVIAFGRDRMVAVAEDPRYVLVRDGRGWSLHPIDTFDADEYYDYSNAVWGTSPTDFYVGQNGGGVHHFDRGAWTALPRVIVDSVYDVAGTPDGDLILAAYGSLVRYHRGGDDRGLPRKP